MPLLLTRRGDSSVTDYPIVETTESSDEDDKVLAAQQQQASSGARIVTLVNDSVVPTGEHDAAPQRIQLKKNPTQVREKGSERPKKRVKKESGQRSGANSSGNAGVSKKRSGKKTPAVQSVAAGAKKVASLPPYSTFVINVGKVE